MRIEWTQKPSADANLEELLKIEYEFRKTMTHMLLKYSILFEDTDDEEDDLGSYEFIFNPLTQKFSLSTSCDKREADIKQLMIKKELRHFF